MKAIVLENGEIEDIPERLIRYLDRHKVDWEHFNMDERFWPENKVATMEIFANMQMGTPMYCYTVFDGHQQLELMIQLFHTLKDRAFSLYIMNNILKEELLKFIADDRSSITPKQLQDDFDEAETKEASDKAWKAITDFKKNIISMFAEVLESHSIYWIYGGETYHIKSIDDIKNLPE